MVAKADNQVTQMIQIEILSEDGQRTECRCVAYESAPNPNVCGVRVITTLVLQDQLDSAFVCIVSMKLSSTSS